MVKRDKIQKVVVAKKEDTEELQNIIERPVAIVESDYDEDDYSEYMNPELYKSKAVASI